MLAFILMQIASWLPNGCHIASHQVYTPERSKKEWEEETSADFGLYLIGQHYHIATAEKTRKINVSFFVVALTASLIGTEMRKKNFGNERLVD